MSKDNLQPQLLRDLPSISHLLTLDSAKDVCEAHGRERLVHALRREVQLVRSAAVGTLPSCEELVRRAAYALEEHRIGLKHVINGTGIVLHTGLGRARLPTVAIEALVATAMDHVDLELNLESGHRGQRNDLVSGLLKELTGAESALVVNNNAGATLLAVTALAYGKEVIVSRGELIEIGGSFRLPDIISACGAKLVEVGTTNRTRIADYRNAVTDQTGLLLKCHPSNYAIVGFTEEATDTELAALSQELNVPFLNDLGSGALVAPNSAPDTLTLPRAITNGASLVTASGDKLLGGPQAGIILGKHELISKLARHPLARALRPCKLTFAALNATLELVASGRSELIPTLAYLNRSEADTRELAARIGSKLDEMSGTAIQWSLETSDSFAGGGSLPCEAMPSVCLTLPSQSGLDAHEIAARLRTHRPSLLCRVHHGRVWIDPRAMSESEVVVAACIVVDVLEVEAEP